MALEGEGLPFQGLARHEREMRILVHRPKRSCLATLKAAHLVSPSGRPFPVSFAVFYVSYGLEGFVVTDLEPFPYGLVVEGTIVKNGPFEPMSCRLQLLPFLGIQNKVCIDTHRFSTNAK